MIVIDASALVALLLSAGSGARVRSRVRSETLAVPHVADLEVLNALRKQSTRLPDRRLALAADTYRSLALARFDHAPHLRRIWELRKNLTAYDASYVALAEVLEAPLLTLDARLASAPGIRTQVELVT